MKFLSAVLLYLLSGAMAFGAPGERIHPLVYKAQKHAEQGKSSFLRHSRQDAQARELISCFIQTDDLAALKSKGWFAGTYTDGVATALLPASSLGQAAALPGVRAILPATRKEPLLNVSSTDTRDGAVYLGLNARDAGPTAERGSGVIVGIIDTGIDFRHKDFIVDSTEGTASPKTRILAIWDQQLNPIGAESHPAGYNYGVEYSEAQIDAVLPSPFLTSVRTTDSDGHGTHVAGIAAGDGSDNDGSPTGSVYAGVASGADLIVVKTTFQDPDIVDAANYVFTKAQALGRPCVINLSLGGHFGSHDGRDPSGLGRLLSSLVDPGYLIVAAMGNERGDAQHTEGTVSTTRTFSFRQNGGVISQVASFWHHEDDAYSISVTGPGGTTPSVAAGGYGQSILGLNDVYIYNAMDASMTQSDGDKNIIVWIEGFAGSSTNWSVQFTRTSAGGSGAVDGWFALPSDGGTWDDPSNDELVSSPADGNNIISVAAYTSRDTFPSEDGNIYSVFAGEVGDFSNFSSPGPLRRESASNPNLLRSPDIAAPGAVIISSFSAQSFAPDSNIADDGRHVIMSGTSMATPHAAGALALALQYNPTLSIDELRTIFNTQHSILPSAPVRQDVFANSPNDNFGFGKLNALGLQLLFRQAHAEQWQAYQ